MLVANQRAKRLGCAICQQPIDYRLQYPDEDSFSVDHIKPRSTHPHLAEEPTNLRSTHLRCNKARGDRDERPGLGSALQTW
ncbi:HNH endonuclease [Pseudarthrobacter sp. NIBRBAC000502770]|uniref:HNH endonuclease n=1 Tax=Pseudarthrobacter sp. NIBRBAC000502770 TaxID=2590785 RepID=UPI00114071AE|nr:HNH endonuclease [Pseudarthrobacter sp. NIBRBAC000502770]